MRTAIKIGAVDEEIIEKAKTSDYVIITKDIRLALRALIEGIKVWYFDDKGNNHKLTAPGV